MEKPCKYRIYSDKALGINPKYIFPDGFLQALFKILQSFQQITKLRARLVY